MRLAGALLLLCICARRSQAHSIRRKLYFRIAADTRAIPQPSVEISRKLVGKSLSLAPSLYGAPHSKTLVLINEINQLLVQSSLEKRQIEQIREFAELHSTRHKMFPIRPVGPLAKIRRNTIVKVRYRDGTIRKGKYKRLKVDILSGNCEILELSSDR